MFMVNKAEEEKWSEFFMKWMMFHCLIHLSQNNDIEAKEKCSLIHYVIFMCGDISTRYEGANRKQKASL